MKREFSAGGIVYRYQMPDDRYQKDRILFLVRRAKANPNFKGSLGWTLPKGRLEMGEKPEQAAIRETCEETGMVAKIIEKIETLKYFYVNPEKERILKFVTFYLMEYVKDNPKGFDWETEEVRWMSLDEIQKELAYASEKKLVLKAFELVQSRSEKI